MAKNGQKVYSQLETKLKKNKEITAIYNAQKVYISTIEIEWEE